MNDKNDKWIKRWEVPGSNDNTWTVALDKDGNYGCSCPVWKFKRKECKHIVYVKNGGGDILEGKKKKPTYRLACVNKPIYKEKENELWIPLIGIPDVHMMEATICYYMLKYGFLWKEIREIRGRIPHEWTAKAVIDYVEYYGEACYPEGWYKGRRGGE